MSVSVVSAQGTDPGSEVLKVTKTIATSFFSDGDMHTYGMPVLLEYATRHTRHTAHATHPLTAVRQWESA
jgi:hypothetical protein